MIVIVSVNFPVFLSDLAILVECQVQMALLIPFETTIGSFK